MRNSKFIIHNSTILGVDPGYGRIGIAVLEKSNKGNVLVHSECFETDSKLPHSERLLLISKKIKEIVKQYKPTVGAVETLLWSKNKKTALQVAEARGVILSELEQQTLIIREFNPNQIKLAVTGHGRSDKKQVINMVERLVKLKPQKRHDDEYDAIAIALTAAAIKTL